MDTLLALRNDVLFSYQDSLSEAQHDSIESKISRTAIHLKEKFISNKPLYFYFSAPLKRVKNYLIQNITQDWPGPVYTDSNVIQKAVKAISFVTYYILLLQIIIFPFLYSIKRKLYGTANIYLLCYILILASIFPFAYLIVMAHYTYFIFGYTLLIPIFVFNMNALITKNQA